MYRHVSTFHLDLVQLWRCPVSWCTVWKGTPQDCMDHVRGAHDVPSNIKSASLNRFFPPWTGVRFGRMPLTHVIQEFQLLFSSSVRYTSLWFTTTGCSRGGCPITPSARTTLPSCGCLFRRRRPWLSVPCLLRFWAARALLGTFAPVMRRQSLLGRHDVSTAGSARLKFGMFLFVSRHR